MPDETTPAPPAAPAAAAAPRIPRANTRALRRLREPIRPQNIAKRPNVYCWDCRRADEKQPGNTCAQHANHWCNTCRSYISNAHDHQDMVGHPEVTDRFLDADLKWTWRPMAFDHRGLPQLDDDGGMWIYLMIGGVERPAYGKPGEGGAVELISNSLANGGIRFGVALNQRAKTDLHAPDNGTGEKTCPGCQTSCDATASFCAGCGHQLPAQKGCTNCGRAAHSRGACFCSDCGHELAAAQTSAAEPEYARPDWIARVNSLLARKRGAYGTDRLHELSEILRHDVDDVAKLSPDDARTAVRILSAGPDLHPPTPAPAPADTTSPAPEPAAPPAEPAPAADPPQPSPRRSAAAARQAKPSQRRTDKTPAPATPGPGAAHVRTITSLLDSRGVPGNDTTARMRIISGALGRTVGSLDELSPTDALTVITGLGSGDITVDPAPAAAAEQDTGPDRSVFDDLCKQIGQALTDEDAGAIKIEIGKALVANSITKADGSALSERLAKRGRQVGLAGAS